MVSYDEAESSAAASRPVELVLFEIGSTTYRYTTGPLALTVLGNAYSPEAVSISSVVLGASAHDQTVQIEVPSTNAFARLFIGVVPADVATCSVLRVQRSESSPFATTQLRFTGRVKAVKFSNDGTKAQVGVQSLESALNKQMSAFTYQGPCNHQLYSAGCGADPGAHTFTGTVSVVSGATITVPGVNASGKDFVSGFCHPTAIADFRMVISQAGDVLTLLLPFASSPLGQDVDVVEGCDHLLDGDCSVKYDRVLEYGGFAFVSLRNPFASGL